MAEHRRDPQAKHGGYLMFLRGISRRPSWAQPLWVKMD
jgi:hypothetical protein